MLVFSVASILTELIGILSMRFGLCTLLCAVPALASQPGHLAWKVRHIASVLHCRQPPPDLPTRYAAPRPPTPSIRAVFLLSVGGRK